MRSVISYFEKFKNFSTGDSRLHMQHSEGRGSGRVRRLPRVGGPPQGAEDLGDREELCGVPGQPEAAGHFLGKLLLASQQV